MPMKKKVSRRELAIQYIFISPSGQTCQQITSKIIKREKLIGSKARYLSGSISSILAKLVKDRVLMYSSLKTKRGGHIYLYNDKKLKL